MHEPCLPPRATPRSRGTRCLTGSGSTPTPPTTTTSNKPEPAGTPPNVAGGHRPPPSKPRASGHDPRPHADHPGRGDRPGCSATSSTPTTPTSMSRSRLGPAARRWWGQPPPRWPDNVSTTRPLRPARPAPHRAEMPEFDAPTYALWKASDLRRLVDLVVPGVCRPVGRALLEEGVTTLSRLVGAVRKTGRLAREQLLADQAVVDQVEGVLEHPLGGR